MGQTIGRLADRLLSVVVPNTAASGCLCDPWECTAFSCGPGICMTYRYNCQCQVIDWFCSCLRCP